MAAGGKRPLFYLCLLSIKNANECNPIPDNCVSLIYPDILKDFAEKQHSHLDILSLKVY